MVRSWVSRSDESSNKRDWHYSKPSAEESPQIYSQPNLEAQAFEANKREAFLLEIKGSLSKEEQERLEYLKKEMDAYWKRTLARFRNDNHLDRLLKNINNTYSPKQAFAETSPLTQQGASTTEQSKQVNQTPQHAPSEQVAPQPLQEQLSPTQEVALAHLDEPSVIQIDSKEVSREVPTSAPQLQAKQSQSSALFTASNKQKFSYLRFESLPQESLEPKQGVDETLLLTANKQKLDFSLGKSEQPSPKQPSETTSVVSRFKERLNVLQQEESVQTQKAKELPHNTSRLKFNKEPNQKLGFSIFEQAQAETKQYTDIASSKSHSDNQRQLLAIRLPTLDDIRNAQKEVQKLIVLIKRVASRSQKVLGAIVWKPADFVKNLIQALRQGLQQFLQPKRLNNYLKNGLVGWLTGGMDVQQKIDFNNTQSLFNLAIGLLGLTWKDYIYPKLEKKYGKANMQRLEKSFTLFIKLKNKGLSGIWEDIKNQIGQLKQLQELVVGEITNMLLNTIIKKAVNKLLSSLFGSILTIIQTCYDLIVFLFEGAKNIAEVTESALGALENVADGNTEGAANLVEKALAKSIPILIGFMASLVGVTNLKDKVKLALEKIRLKIDKAFDKLLDKVEPQVQKLLTTVSSLKLQLANTGQVITTSTGNRKPQTGNTRQQNQKPDNRKNRILNIPEQKSQPFLMYGKSHTLFTYLKNGKCDIEIASRREYYKLVLLRAIEYFENKYGEGKNTEPLPTLRTFLEQVNNYKHKINMAASRASKEAEVISEMHKHLDRMAKKLTNMGNKYQISDLQKLAEDKRYSSGGELRLEYQQIIRETFYGDFNSFSKRNRAKLLLAAKKVAKSKSGYNNFSSNKQKHIYWCENHGGGLQWTPHFADETSKNYKPHLDHIVEVGTHWNTVGYNQTQAEREAWFNDTSNHQIICAHHNTSKSGPTYRKKVGPNFKGPGE